MPDEALPGIFILEFELRIVVLGMGGALGGYIIEMRDKTRTINRERCLDWLLQIDSCSCLGPCPGVL